MCFVLLLHFLNVSIDAFVQSPQDDNCVCDLILCSYYLVYDIKLCHTYQIAFLIFLFLSSKLFLLYIL